MLLRGGGKKKDDDLGQDLAAFSVKEIVTTRL